MYAVEFEAQIKNGVVNIPKEYSDIYQRQAKFLVLIDDVDKEVEAKKVCRKPPAELVGKIKFLGDIIEPVVDEADWDALR